jgi:hypothetical protein
MTFDNRIENDNHQMRVPLVENQSDDVNIHSTGKENRSFAVAAKQLVINQETYLNDLKKDVTPVKL